MLVNQSTSISTSKILLVPYREHHVPTYHEWMKDPDIQQATASEPLTIEEEYSMQHSWRQDSDKLTFITCHPIKGLEENKILARYHDRPGRMIGDVNLFLSKDEEDINVIVGELELMVARKTDQGHGLGRASLVAFLLYILKHQTPIVQEYLGSTDKSLTIGQLKVKIGAKNERSIRLFESAGFQKFSESPNYFGEIELGIYKSTRELEQSMLAQVESYQQLPYVEIQNHS